jgi:hypothetical protein
MSVVNPKWLRRKMREDLRKKSDPNAPAKKMRKEIIRMPIIRKK